uniref:Cardiomyopathy-associated protein 5 n=1 Tax=Cucumis sativus TaxID=3659 RepID=A0A0A0LY78_CUCSA
MDLGLSEIERNRRLESLIARRRARKSYKRKNVDNSLIADTLPQGQVSKIITTRNDPIDLENGCKDIEGIPLPGSAPSVLLPMRNPFDLPYDPHEEKPNLMADSFQQEFTAAHQKDLAFCRHESFCFGPAYPEESGAMGYHPRYRRPSISIADKGEHDWLIEQLLFKGEQVSRPEKKPIAVETRGIQTEDLPQTKAVNVMEPESDQEKEIPPDAESEFEMEPELMRDGNSQSSRSSSPENPENVICDDVRVVSKNFESTLSSALNKTLNCRVPKGRLIKEALCEFSPTAFDKNRMDDRFSYPDKVVCHTPTYSIASDLQVEVSEIGSPPTIDGNNTDAESLNPDWEVEKDVSFGGEQDDMCPPLDGRFNEIVSDAHKEEVKALSVKEASPPKINQSPMPEELVDNPSQAVPQMPEELSFPTFDHDEEAVNHMVDQKNPEALANMKNLVKTREDVDDGLEMFIKQEDNGKETKSLEETYVKSSRSLSDNSEDSSGCQAHSDHEHSEEGSKNMDQITGSGDLGRAHKHSEEGNKNIDQISGSEDHGWAHKYSEEGSKNKDQITGNGDLVQAQEHSEEGIKNMDQITGSEDLGWAHKHPEEGSKNKDQITGNGDLSLVQEDSEEGSRKMDQIIGNGHLGWAHEHSEEGIKNTGQITGNGDLVEPRNVEEQIEFIQDHKHQPNVVTTELQSPRNALKLTVDKDLGPSGGVPPVSIDIMCSGASTNQVNDVQSEYQKSNKDLVEPRKIEEPLELKQDNKNQQIFLETEFQSSKDASKSTVEDDLASDVGMPLHSNDIIDSVASQNQANAVPLEFQKSDDAMKSTPGQDSVIEGELVDTNAGLYPESLMEEQIHMNKVSSSQDSIVENSPKTKEEDDNKPADSIKVENEFIKDLSAQGEKSNLDAKDEPVETDKNLSSPNSDLNVDLKISEITSQEEVAAPNYPLAEITTKEVEVETEPTLIIVTNLENVGENNRTEYESHKFNKQESDIVKDKDLEFDKDMESYSKDLNGNEAEGSSNPSILRANLVGLQKPPDSAHQSPVDSSLIADKGSF